MNKLLTQSELDKLRPVLLELAKTHGHPSRWSIGEILKVCKMAGLDVGSLFTASDLDLLSDLPADSETAVMKILAGLQREVDLAQPRNQSPKV